MEWQASFFDVQQGYSVAPILANDAEYLIMNVHYARRKPSISYAFGLFEDGGLVGIVTYGTPASSTLQKGVCGDQWANDVIELNRLVLLNNKPLEASRLVGASLSMLPKPKIVVSYADTEQSHLGIVYQATNFIYTGLSAKRTDYKIEGLEHLHTQTIIDQFRNTDGKRIDAMKEKYGERLYVEQRSRKHRYIYFVGSKTERKQMRKDLRYPILPYPKERELVNG